MSESPGLDDGLRDAFEYSTGDLGLDSFLRTSMQAGLGHDPGMARQLRDLELRNDAELDLHLHGDAEERHVSRADLLGRFLKETTGAVKQIAKDIGGLQRHSANLWVEAPAAGSMRLVLRTVEPRRLTERPQARSLPGADGRTLDAMAVLTLAALIEQSQEDGPDSPLTAALHELKAPARNAVASLAKVVDDANWRVDGVVTVRGREPARIRFDVADARRLFVAAKTESREVEPVVVLGRVDGWAWSRSTMEFLPEKGRPFHASVPAGMADTVAAIGARANNRVRATFLVTTVYPEGSVRPKGRSYALRELDPLPSGGAAQDRML